MAEERADSSSRHLTRTTREEYSFRASINNSFRASINNSFQASSNNNSKETSCSSLTREPEPETLSHNLQKCSADSPL